MDPFSLTLAVITLATAIKDIIELAERIDDSFAKVSDNLRNAQLLAKDIKQTLYQLKEFCERHYEVLEASPDTKTAVLSLTTKMKLVHANCAPLIPIPSNKRLGRLKCSWHAWKNNNKIEADILDLKNEVKKCYQDFMLFALMRIETRLTVMHHSNTRGMEIVKREISRHIPTQRVISFAESSSATSMPLLKTPSNIRDGVISDMYLRIQIDSIADSLNQLSTMGLTYVPEPTESYVLPYRPLLDSSFLPGDRKALHRDIVSRSLEIRNTLENEPTEVSIQEGAWDLVNLSIGLYYLNMNEEAAMMGLWTVNLFRTLVSVDPKIYTPYLVHSLKHLSRFYEDVQNIDGAFIAIEEATNLSRGLQTPMTPTELRVQFSGILSTYARNVGLRKEYTRAIELAMEAVKLIEDILCVGTLPYSHVKVDNMVEVNPDFLCQLYRSSPSEQAICDYARALRQLSNCLHDDGQLQEALDVKMRALPIFRDIPTMFSGSTNMDAELAGVLYEILTQNTKRFLSSEKLLSYAEDCIDIYRKYAENNSTLYGRTLCDTLWEKANILGVLGREGEALEVWKEIAELAQKLVEDQLYFADALYQVSWSFRRLKRHDEAASTRNQSVMTYQAINKTTSGAQANGYYDLSIDLQLAGRHHEAAQAAQNAVAQYRSLAFDDPDQWTKQIARGLSALANSLFSMNQHENALNEGHESLRIFEKVIAKDPSAIDSYLYALRVNLGLALTTDNEARAMERCEDVVRQFRLLAEDFPAEVGLGLVEAELDLGHNLDRLNRIPEARRHFEDLLARWQNKHPHVEDAALANLQISVLISYASILDNQGHSELALEPLLKSMELGMPFAENNAGLASQTVGAMYRHAHLLCELGRYAESLEAAEKTLEFTRSMKLENLSDVVGTLHVVALAADYSYKPERVVQVANEAVEVCRGRDMLEYAKSNPRGLYFLPRSLYCLAAGLADCGKIGEGLGYAREAVKEAFRLKSVSRLSWADAEPSYMDARGQLAANLLASGEFPEAIEILEERRAYLAERVKERSGAYTNFAVVLRKLGIMHCSEGRHEEGLAAAQELEKIKERLSEVFPSLFRLVDLDLQHDIKTPSLQVLNELKSNLECSHQDKS